MVVVFVVVSVVVFPVTFTFPLSVNGYSICVAVDVCSVIAFAFARLTAETLLSDSFPVILISPVPEFATTLPLLSTSIAEAVGITSTSCPEAGSIFFAG